MFAKFRNYLKVKSNEKELFSLTDRELRDIGITRGDIRRIARRKTVT